MSEVPTTSKMVEEEAKKAPNVPEQITPKIDFSSRETFLRVISKLF